MQRHLRETLDDGYRYFKVKVGTSIDEDKERLSIARSVLGYDKGNVLMVDANQVRHIPLHSSTVLIWARFGLFPKPSIG